MSKIVSLARFANSLNETANTTVIENISLGDSISEKVPPGVVFSFAVETPPTGWLICDGSALSRTTYSKLFSIIGETWGIGDGSTTFNLPDLRGEFLRGWDNGAGNDPDAASRTGGDTVGSSQGDAGINATGGVKIRGTSSGFDSFSGSLKGGGENGSYPTAVGGSGGQSLLLDLSQSWGSSHTSTEFRPRNAAVQYCIKY